MCPLADIVVERAVKREGGSTKPGPKLTKIQQALADLEDERGGALSSKRLVEMSRWHVRKLYVASFFDWFLGSDTLNCVPSLLYLSISMQASTHRQHCGSNRRMARRQRPCTWNRIIVLLIECRRGIAARLSSVLVRGR